MLASDDNNPHFVGAKDPDAALAVEFYIKPIQNMFLSSKNGRPMFDDVIYVRINIPGMKESQIDRPALQEHKTRFPRQWAHFENMTKGDAREIGTPLAEWPILTRSQAEEFRGQKFYTVESLANASDAQINNLGMMAGMSPFTLREKARVFLKSAQDTAIPQQLVDEVAKRDDKIKALEAQMSELLAKLNTPAPAAPVPTVQVPAKRGPGRPSKAEIEARKTAQAQGT